MRRGILRRLRVTGAGKEPAELEFHPTLTFITGASNTGKSHIFRCIDFALGGKTPRREFDEASGYTHVLLEIGQADDVVTIRRTFGDDNTAEWFHGALDRFELESAEELPVSIDRKNPLKTLSGRLVDEFGFDAAAFLVKNQRGQTQALSFRTLAPFFLVSEEEVITEDSPVAPSSFFPTAMRSAFALMVSGSLPSEEEIQRLQDSHENRERARQQIDVLEPIIASLREEIQMDGSVRPDLERDLKEIDERLGALSEQVAASGDAARRLLDQRNEALEAAEDGRARARRSSELHSRFRLLMEHYESDLHRLEFALESGHFFQQLSASYCPRCGQALNGDEECHAETADFADVERSARAEMKKIAPRISDLATALSDVATDRAQAEADERRWRARANTLDHEISVVANPTAEDARRRVRELTTRRREIDERLLRFRELDRYLAIRQEADIAKTRAVDTFRPEQEAASLIAFQRQVKCVLDEWKFPVSTDVQYDLRDDDILIDGKPRAANGKGVRAVTHAAFTIALMRHCFEKGTPHAGFVVIDSPLTPYRGSSRDGEENAKLRSDVHVASLTSLASTAGSGQTIVIDNIDPPADLGGSAVYVFTRVVGDGRAGFYPPKT